MPLAGVARIPLAGGAVLPGLRPGNIADRVAVIAAVRRTLEQIGARPNGRNSELTLVIPDGAVRVLLLDFDALPSKISEALPLVKFRLKKLIPFDADEAMVSFQVMSTSRSMLRVLALAIPRDVLAEYETVAREAGFEPGAVLPSTLASLAGLSEGEGAALVVNAHESGITTAIVRAGIVLLHRAVELSEHVPPTPANLPAELFETSWVEQAGLLPLVNRDDTQAEWAAQEPLPEFGRNPYADQLNAEQATQGVDAATRLGTARVVLDDRGARRPIDMYASAANPAELAAPVHEGGGFEDPGTGPPVHFLAADVRAEEIARAISVAVAYFEDSLSALPGTLLSAGPLGAAELERLLREQGVATDDGVRIRELVDTEAIAPGAVSASVPRGWLAGITGALKS